MKLLQGLENLEGPGPFLFFWPLFSRKGNETGITSRGACWNSDVTGTSVELWFCSWKGMLNQSVGQVPYKLPGELKRAILPSSPLSRVTSAALQMGY